MIAHTATIEADEAQVPAAHSPKLTTRRRLARWVLTPFMIIGILLGAANAASADIVVAGHRFTTSSANCNTNGRLYVYVGGNTNDYSAGRSVRVVMYDYSARQWVYGNWHGMSSWGLSLDREFNFNHHGYYYPELQYAVQTSAGFQYGTEIFSYFNQTTSLGTTRSSNCYV